MKLNREKIGKVISFFCNPHLLLCFALAWMMTNGWSYILLGLGMLLEIKWMIAVAGAYLAFLWLPISPEKLVTVGIAMALLRILFPDDEKTLAALRAFHGKVKGKIRRRREKKENKSASSC